LEKDPERRYQSVKDVRNELEGLREEVKSGSVATVSQSVAASATPATDSGRTSTVGSGVVSSGPTSAVSEASSASSVVTSSKRPIWIGLAAVALLAVGAAWWIGRGGDESNQLAAARVAADETQSAAVSAPSVAVLPFADLSPEKDQEYFTDGMTEELLQALGTIEGLKVPSRTAVFALKGKDLDIQQVGERLGVETVLEGSVRKSGDQLRISTQLVQVSDGFKLWSETYDRELKDVFSVQDEIASSIAEALRVTLGPDVKMATQLGGTENTKAYDFYLKGIEYEGRATTQDRTYARQMFEQALKLDPDYALAYAALTRSLGHIYQFGGGDVALLDEMDAASRKALDLEPGLAEAHVARASYFNDRGDTEAAIEEYEEAIRLDPNNADSYWAFGRLRYQQGDFAETARLWEKSIELDPEFLYPIVLTPQVYTSLGLEDEVNRSLRRIVVASERHLELNPDDYGARLVVASALLELGERVDEAMLWASVVLASDTDDALTLYNLACFYSKAENVDKALESLERAVDAGYHDAAWVRQDSDLNNIRDDPHFGIVLDRMEQMSAGNEDTDS
jgi:TolB-like protein/Tfp pilus assembly protein PilF